MKPGISNREVRTQIAKETLAILHQGYYMNTNGQMVQVQSDVEQAIHASTLYSPHMLLGVKEEAVGKISGFGSSGSSASITVTAESTLAAVKRLVADEAVSDTVCLNFASAKNPGGGFLGGSQAQEESLARSSALYPCIARMEEMYEHNRQQRSCFYSDYMIHSPQVPIIRNDGGALLREPHLASFISAPAVNAGVVREREPGKSDRS